MTAQHIDKSSLGITGLREWRRMLVWLMLSILAALLVYFGFRGYLNPDLLFYFSNSFHC